MLSSEGSVLARLILARHTLVCRAIELDAKFEVLGVIESLQAAVAGREAKQVRAGFSRSRRRLAAELILLPALVADLEAQIERARRRLDVVSPGAGR